MISNEIRPRRRVFTAMIKVKQILRKSHFILGMSLALGAFPLQALAVPSFAQQTGQPCSACHVGAFGPQLKPYGRDFKLYGYQSSDGKSKVPPIAMTVQTSVTHTNADQNPPPAPNFGPNDNFAVDQVSLYYAGKAPQGFGAFAQFTYDGVARSFHIDNVDIRKAKDTTLFGRDSVIGLDFNNSPTVEDVWNTTPAWGFPYNSSPLSTGGPPTAQIEGALGQQVVGAGVYALWDDTLYGMVTAYSPLERQFAGRLGVGTGVTSDRYVGPIPYWRLALLHDFGPQQTVQVGTYGMKAQSYPGGVTTAGLNSFTDIAVDGTYQYIGSEKYVWSAHGTYIHETQDLAANAQLQPGSRARTELGSARADLSYSYDNTWTPSVQVFKVDQQTDPNLTAPQGRSSGYVAELAYVPFGKPNSPLYWVNARAAIQYIAYREFNGDRVKASDNNTLYLSFWVALAPFGAMVHR